MSHKFLLGKLKPDKMATLDMRRNTKEKVRRLILIQELWDTCQQFILYVPQFGRMCPVGILKLECRLKLGTAQNIKIAHVFK